MYDRYAETFALVGLGIVAGWFLRELYGLAFRAWIVPLLEARMSNPAHAPVSDERLLKVIQKLEQAEQMPTTPSRLDPFFSRKFAAFLLYGLAVMLQRYLHLTPEDLNNLFNAMLTYVGVEGSADLAGRIFPTKKETKP